MVEVALLEHLLVQARAVEPGGQPEFDVPHQGLVARGGHQALGPVALVQHQALEDRASVDQDAPAPDRHRAQAGVGVGRVDDRAVGVQDFQAQPVQVRVLRRPEAHALVGHGEDEPGRQVEVGAGPGGGDLPRRVAEHGAHPVAGQVGGEGELQEEAARGDVGGDAGPLQGDGAGDGLHPHRLPDAGGPGVVAVRVGVPGGLLAARLRAVPGVAGADHDRRLGAGFGDAVEVGGEGGEAPAVPGDLDAVHPDRGVVVHGPEVQQDAGAGPLGGHRHGAPVPDRLQEVRVPDARQGRLGAEGHGDGVRERAPGQPALQTAVGAVGLELPGAVQIEPRVADELGPGVLGARQVRRVRDGHGAPRVAWCVAVRAYGTTPITSM